MFKRFNLYIDIFTDGNDYAHVLKHLESHSDYFEPITRVLKELKLPECIYDLLIIDAKHILNDQPKLAAIKPHYEDIIVINAFDSPAFFDFLYQNNIKTWLKANYYTIELKSLIDQYMLSKQYKRRNVVLDNLMNSAQNSIVITDIKGNIQYANPYFESISGYTQNEFFLKSPNVIKSGLHDKDFYENLWKSIRSGRVWEGIFINKNKSKQIFYEEATISPLRNVHGEIENFLKIGKNITRERLLLDELSKEMKLAKRIVETLLPRPYASTHIRFDYTLLHYNEIGGDFLFFEEVKTNLFCFALIDVTGHGVSAALTALTVGQMFGDYMKFQPLCDTIETINRFLCTINAEFEDRNQYITGVFVSADFNTGALHVINAGHLDVIVQSRTLGEYSWPSNNMMMGVLGELRYPAERFTLSDIQALICFTDGLFEKQNLTYEYTLKKLKEQLKLNCSLSDIIDAFDVRDHLSDDVTLCKLTF